ncbi:MAG: glycosyltransferase [Candidatus Levybacteria bacterium]|nr:glycosyltransferase [Candidatus Levybacteria bacterium]
MKIKLSVIYVYYNTPEELSASIKSLEQACAEISYEVVIVDNNSPKSITEEIYNRPNLRIIKNKVNCGYGKGLNQGASVAKGEYLLLANPDVKFAANSIKYLLGKMESNSKIGVIAPQLIGEKENILQSISGMPYLSQSLFAFSFLGKIWRKNPFSAKYHNINLDRNKEQEVDVVGGACMMVKKSIFDKVGGFDERFFMYFEEADFCFRIKKMGYKILYFPKTKATHSVGRSTQDKAWIEKTFEQSRFKFFKKYHGLIPALLGEFALRFFKPANILLLTILALSAFLNLYKLNEQMIFIGDQGWFYLSARDMILSGNIPLVGITSSHTWLHQGPLWTYLLALILWISSYNPLSGGYFTALLGVITVVFVYKLGKEMFSKRVGLISALLYATSPLIIINSQMPYHTSPIPLLTLGLINSVFKWIKGDVRFFPITILFMALLYNFELATQIFWFPTGFIFIVGFMGKKQWAKAVLRTGILLTSLALFILPMIPILIYDINHKFAQTLKFFIWIQYRTFSQLLNFKNTFLLSKSQEFFSSMINFFSVNYQQLIFAQSNLVSLLILSLSIVGITFYLLKNRNVNNLFSPISLLIIFIIIPSVGFFLNMTASGAYLPIFFPSVIIITAWMLDGIMHRKYLFFPILVLVFYIAALNTLFVLDKAKSKPAYGIYFSERLNAVKTILKETNGEDYGIKGNGSGSQFESFTMNYEYLTWWLGKPPSKNSAKNLFIISESKDGIVVDKKIINK